MVDTSRHSRNTARFCDDGAGHWMCVWSNRLIDLPPLPRASVPVIEIVMRVSIHPSLPIAKIDQDVTNGLRCAHEVVLATDRVPAG